MANPKPNPSRPDDSTASDKRFAAEAWRQHPGFDLMARNYLSFARVLCVSIDATLADTRT